MKEKIPYFTSNVNNEQVAEETGSVRENFSLEKEVREEIKKVLSLLGRKMKIIERAEQDIDKKNEPPELKKERKLVFQRFTDLLQPLIPFLLCAFFLVAENKPQHQTPAKAKAQLLEKGITNDQAKAYIPGISELLARGVVPFNYDFSNQIKNFVPNLILGKEQRNQERVNLLWPSWQRRDDAWRLYLGLPQRNNTFGISEYSPSVSKERGKTNYYFKINNFLKYHRTGKDIPISYFLNEIHKMSGNPTKAVTCEFDDVMGDYTLSKGEDKKRHYISYYDKWDFKFPESLCPGKGFEIYDRIYYDPQTLKVIENVEENG